MTSQPGIGYWSHHPEPSLVHRSFADRPIVLDSGASHYIRTDDGKQILDACGGAAVTCIGLGNQEVISAITQQLQSLSYAHSMAYTTPVAERLADVLVGHRPGGLSKAYFTSSGSEAMDAALKIARQYQYEKGEKQRTHLISRRQSYHGNTFGGMSVSNNLARLVPYADILLPNVSHVSPSYAYQYKKDSESEQQYLDRLVQEVEDEFQRVGPENVIAFVAETVGGATSGCILPVPGYLAAVKRICQEHGALLILDEIMCGMGRTGTFFAWEPENVVPDIMTCGKGLGGGYIPLSAVLVQQDVIKVLSDGTGGFNHGQTFQAHPAACAGALAVQTIIKREDLVARCAKMGNLLEEALKAMASSEECIGDVRGRGLFWGIEFVRDKRTKAPFDSELKFGPAVQQRAFELGVNIYPGHGTIDGFRGDHVLLAPPYTVTAEEIQTIVRIVTEAYRQVLKEKVGR